MRDRLTVPLHELNFRIWLAYSAGLPVAVDLHEKPDGAPQVSVVIGAAEDGP